LDLHRPREVVSLIIPLKEMVYPLSCNLPVDFDHKGEIVPWEEDDELWNGLPLDWALDGAFEEKALTIRDVMEEEFLREKMLARQKSKGKRELLNLQSSINNGNGLASSRRRKG
jgi:hypothetical protein